MHRAVGKMSKVSNEQIEPNESLVLKDKAKVVDHDQNSMEDTVLNMSPLQRKIY